MRLPKQPAALARPSSRHPVRVVAPVDGWPKAGALGTVLALQRTEVLRHLVRGELSVKELADELDLSRNDVSYHLAALRELGVVEYVRKGRNLIYRLGPKTRLVRRGQVVLLRLGGDDLCQITARIQDSKTDLSPRRPAPKLRLTPRDA